MDEFVTVAMTFKNSAETLGEVLDAIRDLVYPKDRIKLVFVDGESTDNSMDILRDFLDEHGKAYFKTESVSKPCGITEGRNICLDLAEGYCVIFVDSDVLVPPELISKSLEMLKMEKVAFINVACVCPEETQGWLDKIYLVLDEPLGMSCAVIRLSALETVGKNFVGIPAGENPAELSLRLRRKGYRTVATTDIEAVHVRQPATIRGYWKGILSHSADLNIPLLVKRDKKTILRYGYYSLLLASFVYAFWNWVPMLIILIVGIVYQVKKAHGKPHGLLFLTGGLLLPLSLILHFLRQVR